MNMKDGSEFDELLALENEIGSKESLILSRRYAVKVGGFGEENGIVAYYCTIPVQFLQSDISTFEHLTEDKSWPVSQIIQREIDRTRISEIAKSYILKKDIHVKYFPPLTIAILPRDASGAIGKTFSYSNSITDFVRSEIFRGSSFSNSDKAESLFLKAENKSCIDGLYLLRISEAFDYNVLCWQKDKYYFVVIDGQHRFEALIQSMERDPLVGNYLQDVIFLDLSRVIQGTNDVAVRAVRKVFLDINREAQRVNPVRQILMDDKDLASLCVQSIVNDDSEDGNSGSFLAPQLIDWHGDGMKHSLPHLTGVLVLHQLIGDSFLKKNLNSLDDLHNPKLVRDWVQVMNSKFDVDRLIDSEPNYFEVKKLTECLAEYEKRIGFRENGEDSGHEVAMFSFDYKVLDIAKAQFDAIYLKAFLLVFHRFGPYSDLIEFIKEKKGFVNKHVCNRALIMSPEKLELKKNLKYKEFLIELKGAATQNMREYGFIFSVVFQRSIFEYFIKRLDQDITQGYSNAKAVKLAERVVAEINQVMDVLKNCGTNIFRDEKNVPIPKTFSKSFKNLGAVTTSFWEGLILFEGRTVYNLQGIKSLAKLLEYMIDAISMPDAKDIDSMKFDIPGLLPRIERVLRKNFNFEDDADIKVLAKHAARGRQLFLNSLIINGMKKNSV